MNIEYIGKIDLPTSGTIQLPYPQIKESSIQFVELYGNIDQTKRTNLTSLQIELLNDVNGHVLKTVYFILPPHYKQIRLEPSESNVKLNCTYLRIKGHRQSSVAR